MLCRQEDAVNSYESPHSLEAFKGLGLHTVLHQFDYYWSSKKEGNRPKVRWISACVVELDLSIIFPHLHSVVMVPVGQRGWSQRVLLPRSLLSIPVLPCLPPSLPPFLCLFSPSSFLSFLFLSRSCSLLPVLTASPSMYGSFPSFFFDHVLGDPASTFLG